MKKLAIIAFPLVLFFRLLGIDFASQLMLLMALLLMGLGLFKEYEPLLLIPIGLGAFLANFPGSGMDSHYFEANLVQKSPVLFVDGKVSDEPQAIPLDVNGALYLDEKGEFSLDEKEGLKQDLLCHASYSQEGVVFKALPNSKTIKYMGDIIGEEGVLLRDGDEISIGGVHYDVKMNYGLFSHIYKSLLKTGILPPLIFMGVGAMTDFSPLMRNVGLAFYGAAAQLGIFTVFLLSVMARFTQEQAAALGIIGGADGPTAVYLALKLAPELLGPIAVAAYSYMALVPIIIPMVVYRLTTADERKIHMKNQDKALGVSAVIVSKRAKIAFPIVVILISGIVVPSSVVLIGMLMLGNLLKESGIVSVVERLAGVAKGALINILTIFLGLCVGGTMKASTFLEFKTIFIIFGGFIAFAISIAGGIMAAKIYNKFAKDLGWKLTNPLIGATGLSAVPMASRVANEIAIKEDPSNNILHYCMASNIAGVIGSAVAAGFFLKMLA